MPLRAYIDKEEIISIDQSDEQWNDLKKKLKGGSFLKLPCCNQDGFLRTSNKGLKHFVHSKSENTCDWKPESPEHLKAKIDIIEACKENGWKAIPEFSEINWRADVLAIQGDKRIAFEVQWSKQTFEETKFRQDRYKDSNVRGCWFFRTAPKELRSFDDSLNADKDIPAFKIFKDENSNIIGQLKQTQLPLKKLVDSLLKRKLKFCENIRLKGNQEATIVFFEISCWKCHKPQYCYTVEQNLQTVCNQNFHLIGTLWDSDDIDKKPQIYEVVKKIISSENRIDIKVGQLKKRFSNTVQSSYLSHGCYYCDVIFGDFYLTSQKNEGKCDPKAIKQIVKIDLGTIKEEGQHWCYSENEHCE
jgi:hypothetical protein